jgi:hypothetical protein
LPLWLQTKIPKKTLIPQYKKNPSKKIKMILYIPFIGLEQFFFYKLLLLLLFIQFCDVATFAIIYKRI